MPDPFHRLRALLNELVDEGLLLRRRQPDQKDNRNDPTWQYVYRLADPVPQRIASGEDTPAAVIAEFGWRSPARARAA